MFEVKIKKKVLKLLKKMPLNEQKKMGYLLKDLQRDGPVQLSWPNYSKIGDDLYHCHLSYKWVACWKYEDELLTIEVYYAGSRENAPY